MRLGLQETESNNGNSTIMVLAAIPMLLSAFRSFAIENIHTNLLEDDLLMNELKGAGEIQKILDHYQITGQLRQDMFDLQEIRNEIIHPIPKATGTKDNWPDYLRRIKRMGLLDETGRAGSHFDTLYQVCSLRLFRWAAGVVASAVQFIDKTSPELQPLSLAKNFTILTSI
jgi:hypothetical protein